jgi:hypothetical protein
MATIRIGNVTGAIYQSDQPIHLNPDGSAQASVTYKCVEGSAFAIIPAYLTPHPYLPELKCYESDLDKEHGGIVRITSIYRGVLATNPEQLAQHEFSRTTVEAPIETHPAFSVPYNNPPVTASALAYIELSLQNCQAPDINIQDPDGTKYMNTAAIALYKKKRRGIESFLKPGGIYKKTYVSSGFPPSSLINKVGKISEPGSPAPSAPTGQNYLCIGISWAKQAGVVTIMEEYQLSGPGGWDPDLYAEGDGFKPIVDLGTVYL